jgi:hypothetical protein
MQDCKIMSSFRNQKLFFLQKTSKKKIKHLLEILGTLPKFDTQLITLP